MAATIRGIRDDQLDTRTPCGGITVGALLDHVDSLCVAFAAAGEKQRLTDGGQAPAPDASRLARTGEIGCPPASTRWSTGGDRLRRGRA
jgi:hypothetical protein